MNLSVQSIILNPYWSIEFNKLSLNFVYCNRTKHSHRFWHGPHFNYVYLLCAGTHTHYTGTTSVAQKSTKDCGVITRTILMKKQQQSLRSLPEPSESQVYF